MEPDGGTHKTGRMFFSDMEGNFLSEFHVGDMRPDRPRASTARRTWA